MMKGKLRLIPLLLALILLLTACGSENSDDAAPALPPQGDFEPETTAFPGGETMADVLAGLDEEEENVSYVEMDVAEDAPLESEESGDAQNETASGAGVESFVSDSAGEQSTVYTGEMPFASPTPQPNAVITRYSQVSGTGLGFKFNHPADWNNVPGRSSVCYVQPLEDGTLYPARVCVTMKQLSHKCNAETAKDELVSYLKALRTQYDSASFSVDTTLDTSTKFMGNNAMSTTYLAYDGTQEIEGYVILTYFERYLYVFHFLCAYNDYPAFESAMRYMRESVEVFQES